MKPVKVWGMFCQRAAFPYDRQRLIYSRERPLEESRDLIHD